MILDLAQPRKDEILGIGLDSAEVGYPPARFVEQFARAVFELVLRAQFVDARPRQCDTVAFGERECQIRFECPFDMQVQFASLMRTLKTKDDFKDLMVAYLTRANADGVKHAEIFFDPQVHVCTCSKSSASRIYAAGPSSPACATQCQPNRRARANCSTKRAGG